MDQLKGGMPSTSRLDDVCTKGIESITPADQPQLNFRRYTPSNIFVGEMSEENLPGVAVNEVMNRNNTQSVTTFSWLMQNYEASQGYSLPRCLIYEHYMDFCQRNVLQPVNAASFGKAIRQVFPDIRTRRLGNRGQSKYHYYGLKVRCDSPYYSMLVASQRMSLPCQTGGQWLAKAFSSATPSPGHLTAPSTTTKIPAEAIGRSEKSIDKGESVGDVGKSGGGMIPGRGGGVGAGGREGGITGRSAGKNVESVSSATLQRDPGEKTPHKGVTVKREPSRPITPVVLPASNALLPTFPTSRELIHLPQTVDHNQVDEFLKDYRMHCAIILEVIIRGGLDEVDYYFRTFWSNLTIGHRCLLEIPSMCDALAVCDTYLYHTIASILVPGTLNTVPQSLLQSIRQFAYEIPRIVQTTLKSCPNQLMQSKTPAVKRFSCLLRRKTSLAHLAQASRSALAVDVTITQMRLDWERRTEHDTVCSQLIWTMPDMKGLKHEDIRAHMDSFQKLLESHASVEDHVKWVEEVRSFYVEKGYPPESVQYEKAERAFFMGWSYVCSLIIRDQTLRSATSFGSFHLLNLLYEEYLLYVIEVYRYQREEVALWNNVMGVNTPMADGFLVPDVDLEMDDCDDLLDISTSSVMSMGAGDDLFDDDAILSASSAVSAVPPTVPDKMMARTQTTEAHTRRVRSDMDEPVTKHVKPILPKQDIISMAFAASGQPAGNKNDPNGKGKEFPRPDEPVPSLASTKQLTGPIQQTKNETTEKEKGAKATETPGFVTTKLIRATLLTQSDQKALNSSSSASAIQGSTGRDPKETPAAPSVLNLNVPMLPGLDLHRGQFLTAGDGNKYIINDVQTVLQHMKEEPA